MLLHRTARRSIYNITVASSQRSVNLTSRLSAFSTNVNMSDHGAVSSAIIKDHRELDERYNNIINATDKDTQTRWQNQFTWELARHSIGEELVVYPAFEKYMGDKGKSMADKDRKEHLVVKEALKKFQNLSPGSSEFIPALKSLMSELSQHIKEEESDDLPALEHAIAEDNAHGTASEDLAKSFERTKMFVPTRSHPRAPDKPPFETVAGLLAALLDRLGDIFRKFPKESPSTM